SMSETKRISKGMETKMVKILKNNWRLYMLLLPGVIWLIVFMYIPMYGVTIAFKDYNAKLGILGSPWAGMKYFNQFFSTNIAYTVIKNTIALSVLTLFVAFPIPVLFALFLNQLKNAKYKKFVQTVSYAPYFISNVVVVSIMA